MIDGPDFFERAVNIAYDEVKRLYGVDFRDQFAENSVVTTKILLALIQAISAGTIICYHQELRSELLKHEIDIGDTITKNF